jgi:hypothetical protein
MRATGLSRAKRGLDMVALMPIWRRSSPMLERIRAGHFATLFSEGPETDEAPLPAKPPPAPEGLVERARRLSGLLARRAPRAPLQARESAAT